MDQAHGMRLQHAIFHGPLAVDLEMDEVDTPDEYRKYPGGDALPKTLRAWKVQTRKYPQIDPGVVSDPYQFEDSPDSEWISGGLNSKGPESMAIGRQGNLFLWGFFAQPSDMTESARRVFVNSIVYMKQFDGAKPIVKIASGYNGRDWALVRACRAKSESKKEFDPDRFPARVLAVTGPDPTKLEAFYRENFEMLHLVEVRDPRGGSQYNVVFDVDDDLKTLGVGNRSPEFVPKLLELLQKTPADELCARLAKRYLAVAPSIEPAKLLAWYQENKPFLFFSDRAGYVWLVDEATKKAKSAPVNR